MSPECANCCYVTSCPPCSELHVAIVSNCRHPLPTAFHPAAMPAGPYPPMFLHHTPTHPSHNNSLSMSPFNASLLQVLGQQSTPTSQDDVFEDSLGMLSTVALYHGELSNTSVSGASTPMQERLAAMRISSASGKWLLYCCVLRRVSYREGGGGAGNPPPPPPRNFEIEIVIIVCHR